MKKLSFIFLGILILLVTFTTIRIAFCSENKQASTAESLASLNIPTGLGPNHPAIIKATEVRDRYEYFFLIFPKVVGTGIGFSEEAGQVVIEVYLKNDSYSKCLLPHALEGIPVKPVITGDFSTQLPGVE